MYSKYIWVCNPLPMRKYLGKMNFALERETIVLSELPGTF